MYKITNTPTWWGNSYLQARLYNLPHFSQSRFIFTFHLIPHQSQFLFPHKKKIADGKASKSRRQSYEDFGFGKCGFAFCANFPSRKAMVPFIEIHKRFAGKIQRKAKNLFFHFVLYSICINFANGNLLTFILSKTTNV